MSDNDGLAKYLEETTDDADSTGSLAKYLTEQ